jgi:hypothetical protein
MIAVLPPQPFRGGAIFQADFLEDCPDIRWKI